MSRFYKGLKVIIAKIINSVSKPFATPLISYNYNYQLTWSITAHYNFWLTGTCISFLLRRIQRWNQSLSAFRIALSDLTARERCISVCRFWISFVISIGRLFPWYVALSKPNDREIKHFLVFEVRKCFENFKSPVLVIWHLRGYFFALLNFIQFVKENKIQQKQYLKHSRKVNNGSNL